MELTKQEVIKEVKAILSDFLDEKISKEEVKEYLNTFANETGYTFNQLYNVMMSSRPNLYLV